MKIEKLNTIAWVDPCLNEMREKINELIDAFNSLQEPNQKAYGSISDKEIEEWKKTCGKLEIKKEKEPETLPCPWCSVKPIVIYLPYFCVMCENSDCHIRPQTKESYDTKQEAITAWNKRAK